MSYTILKGTGGPTLQASGGLSTDRYGLATATARWWVLEESKLDLVGKIGSKHPKYATLECERRNISEASAGFYIDASFAGLLGKNDPVPVCDIDTGTEQVPLQDHPNYGALSTYAILDADGAFKKMSDSAPFGLKGLTHYEVASVIGRESKIVKAAGVPQTLFVGKIDLTVPTEITARVSGSGNWRLMGFNVEPRGSVFFVRREWKYSGDDRQYSIFVYL